VPAKQRALPLPPVPLNLKRQPMKEEAKEEALHWLNAPKNLRWVDVGHGNGAFTEELIARCAPAAVTARFSDHAAPTAHQPLISFSVREKFVGVAHGYCAVSIVARVRRGRRFDELWSKHIATD
jgi:hypothetical protein